MFAGQRRLRPRREFSGDAAYDAYVRNQWAVQPTVTRDDRGWFVTWGDGTEVRYVPSRYVLELCRLVGHECLAASLFFEHGVTPDGRPWGQQLWWRFRLWLDHERGRSDRHKVDDDEEPSKPVKPWGQAHDLQPQVPVGSGVSGVASRAP